MERLRLLTDGGAISGRLHPTPEGDAAVLWVFGAGGGLGGPAGGLYPRLAQRLRIRGVMSVELAWRQPARMAPCIADLLAGLDWLAGQRRRRVALVGHSFGGAVVIAAGAAREEVVAVAALSSQSAGTELAGALAPRPLLLVHGLADEILPADCSRDIHRRAARPFGVSPRQGPLRAGRGVAPGGCDALAAPRPARAGEPAAARIPGGMSRRRSANRTAAPPG